MGAQERTDSSAAYYADPRLRIVVQSGLTTRTRMAEFHGPPSGITGHPEQQSILTNRGTRKAKERNWGASGFAVGIIGIG